MSGQEAVPPRAPTDPAVEAEGRAIFRAAADGSIARAIEASPRLQALVADLACRSSRKGWSYTRYLVELNRVVASN